jgi:hypothetical protein
MNFKELHQKMIENGLKINSQTEIAVNMAKMMTFEKFITEYGDCPATQDYPAAISVQIGKKAWDSVLVAYQR